jgi:hypothetical protein
MNKSCLTIALTLTCLFGLGVSAHAQDADGVVVKVPFEFVAGAKTLPAGTYRISRIHTDATSGLLVYSRENSSIVLPTAVGASAERATLSFDRVGNMHFLSEVDTPEGVYTMAIPRPRAMVAVVKDHGAGPSSGGN